MEFNKISIPKVYRSKYRINQTVTVGTTVTGSSSSFTGYNDTTDLSCKILKSKVLLIPDKTPDELEILIPEDSFSLSISNSGITGSVPESPIINVIDNLLSTSVTDALSANQGKILKDMINSIGSGGISAETDPTVPAWAKQPSKPTYNKSEIGLGNVDNSPDYAKSVLYAATAGSAPASDVYSWAKAASKPAYTYNEVGAAAYNHTHNYLPLTGGTMSGSIDGIINIIASGKIEAQALVIPNAAPSNSDPNKWYLYIE